MLNLPTSDTPCAVTTKVTTPSIQGNLDKPTPDRKNTPDSNKAKADGWKWHQLDYMSITSTLLQTDK